jgi:FlaA1/EpsC-like NDP-sugar epimerase
MKKHIRVLILMTIDSVIISLSIYLAYLLRFDFNIEPSFVSTLPYVMLSNIVLITFCFYVLKIYKRIWQYASVGDLISIFKGVFIGIGSFLLAHHFIIHKIYPTVIVPRSIYLITAMIVVLVVGGSRFIWRILRDNYNKIQPHHHRALIVGAGDAGIMVVRELKHTYSEFYPVAFIDDNDQKKNLEVVGVPVVGNRYDIPLIVKHYNIQHIIIAIPSTSKSEVAAILDICKNTGCQIKIIPRVNDLINGKISVNMIRDVSVEDLLGRDSVKVDLDEIAGYLSGQVVLVTGAGGSIGSELCRQIAGFNPKQLVLLGHGENSIYEIELELRKKHPKLRIEAIIADIQHQKHIRSVFNQYRPQVIFHAAAHKHVPMMEKNPLEAVKNNILGTKNVAECAHEYKARRFVMVSTDKAVNPANVMGACKRVAEMIVQSLGHESETSFSAVRFGNVLGSRGSVIPIFKRQIEEGGPVTVTHPDMIRYFMTIPEAVQLVVQTGAFAVGGEVFILDMGKPVKIADLAHDLIRLSGLEPDKDIKVVYSGVRPGEKLFEEILTTEEGASATKHDRIYVSMPNYIPYEQLKRKVRDFERMVLDDSKPLLNQEIKKQLKNLVPTYQYDEEATVISSRGFDEAYRTSREIVAAIDIK